MASVLSRRGPLLATLTIVLALAAFLATAALRTADAQEPEFFAFFGTETGAFSNGNRVVDTGVGGTLVHATCTGNSPRSGANIPAQVVTQVTSATTFAIRVLHANGSPMNATVTVNCDFVVADPEVFSVNTGTSKFQRAG